MDSTADVPGLRSTRGPGRSSRRRTSSVSIPPEEAVRALRHLGGGIDPRNRGHVNHVLVGVKGAPRGTALEVVDVRPVELVIGRDPRHYTVRLERFDLVGEERYEDR